MRRLALPLVLMLASAAGAEDVVVLQNGREIRGRIVEERPDAVKLDIGGGKMTFRRAQIAEVRRERAVPEAAAPGEAPAPDPALRREEHSLLYVDGERVGTRAFRAAKLPDGYLFEEELRFLDPKGVPRLELRTIERADLDLRPLTFQVRETDGVSEHRSVTGEMVAGRLRIVFAKDGDKEKKDVVAPEGTRFPFAAREHFLRESRSLSGAHEYDVWDTRENVLRKIAYREGGVRPLRTEGQSLQARLVVRRRGSLVEREWLAPDLSAPLTEMNGSQMLAIATTRQAVERLRGGDTDRVTGADSAARTRYVDRERGWRIEKPDPTWTFEKPPVSGTGALLVVRNDLLFATVDVMTDPDARKGTTPEQAAEALRRLCSTVAPDLQLLREGWIERDELRTYWMEVAATTKGERTKTLARVVVKDGVVFRLLAACPERAFDTLRPDLERVLDSFVLE